MYMYLFRMNTVHKYLYLFSTLINPTCTTVGTFFIQVDAPFESIR